MPESSYYVSTQSICLDHVQRICDNAERAYDKFQGFRSGALQRAYFEHGAVLPPLDEFPGIRYGSIDVTGFLPIDIDPFAEFHTILSIGMQEIARIGRLFIQCAFAEINSKQTKRDYDMVKISVITGEKTYIYSAGRSRPRIDINYCTDRFHELVSTVELPLRIQQNNGGILITHAENGCYFSPEHATSCPSSFACELPHDTVDTLIWRLERTLHVAAKKRFEYSWNALPELTGRLFTPIPESLSLYHLIVQAGFPAQSHEIHVEFFLDTLPALESLRQLCGPKDQIFTHLCDFNLTKETWANLGTETTADGHRIRLETRLPIDVHDVSKTLGIAMQPSR